MNTRSLFLSALVAGAAIGVLSSIPLVSAVNCLLCGWVWMGGIFAVWMYKRNTGVGPEMGPSAGVGALAGLIGAVVATLISGLLTLAGIGSSAISPQMMQQMEQMMGEVPAILASSAAMLAVGFLITLVLYPIFGALGGLIGSALFKGR